MNHFWSFAGMMDCPGDLGDASGGPDLHSDVKCQCDSDRSRWLGYKMGYRSSTHYKAALGPGRRPGFELVTVKFTTKNGPVTGVKKKKAAVVYTSNTKFKKKNFAIRILRRNTVRIQSVDLCAYGSWHGEKFSLKFSW
jgi:hypothetical protein